MKKLTNQKMNIYQPQGAPVPRVYRRRARGQKVFESLLIKCGDCDHKVEIYPDPREGDGLIEINGVLAHKSMWKMIMREAGIF